MGAGLTWPAPHRTLIHQLDTTKDVAMKLSDTDLAAVASYTKNAWSNQTRQLVQPSEVVTERSISGALTYRGSKDERSY